MRGRNYKALRRMADEVIQCNVTADRLQAEGSRHSAALARWRAARRSLWAEEIARSAYGRPNIGTFDQLAKVSREDYLQ